MTRAEYAEKMVFELERQAVGLRRYAWFTLAAGIVLGMLLMWLISMPPVWIDQVAAECGLR